MARPVGLHRRGAESGPGEPRGRGSRHRRRQRFRQVPLGGAKGRLLQPVHGHPYEVTLLIYAAWGGTPKKCTIVFTLLKAAVYINRVANVPATPDFIQPSAELESVDDAWWINPLPDKPNDNFGHYRLDYWKQFGPLKELQANTSQRVPALPAVAPAPVPGAADAGVLSEWDLTTLDAGVGAGNAPDSKLFRGEACTFTLRLYTIDTTIVPGGPHHDKNDYESVKIVNDL